MLIGPTGPFLVPVKVSLFPPFCVTASRFLHKRVRKIIRVDCSVVEMVPAHRRSHKDELMLLNVLRCHLTY